MRHHTHLSDHSPLQKEIFTRLQSESLLSHLVWWDVLPPNWCFPLEYHGKTSRCLFSCWSHFSGCETIGLVTAEHSVWRSFQRFPTVRFFTSRKKGIKEGRNWSHVCGKFQRRRVVVCTNCCPSKDPMILQFPTFVEFWLDRPPEINVSTVLHISGRILTPSSTTFGQKLPTQQKLLFLVVVNVTMSQIVCALSRTAGWIYSIHSPRLNKTLDVLLYPLPWRDVTRTPAGDSPSKKCCGSQKWGLPRRVPQCCLSRLFSVHFFCSFSLQAPPPKKIKW